LQVFLIQFIWYIIVLGREINKMTLNNHDISKIN